MLQAAQTQANGNADADAVLRSWVPKCTDTLKRGKTLWHSGKKQECLALYFQVTRDLAAALPSGAAMQADVASSVEAAEGLRRKAPSKAASTLKQAMNRFIASATDKLSGAVEPSEAAQTELAAQVKALEAKRSALAGWSPPPAPPAGSYSPTPC